MRFSVIVPLLLTSIPLAAPKGETPRVVDVTSWNIAANARGNVPGKKPWLTLFCHLPLFAFDCRKYAAIAVLQDEIVSNMNTIIALQGVDEGHTDEIVDLFDEDWERAEPPSLDNSRANLPSILYRPKYAKCIAAYTFSLDLRAGPAHSPTHSDAFLDHKVVIAHFEDLQTGIRFIVVNTELSNTNDHVRLGETRKTLEHLEYVRTRHNVSDTILVGSFQGDAEDLVYNELDRQGWRDLWKPDAIRGKSKATCTTWAGVDWARNDYMWLGSQNKIFKDPLYLSSSSARRKGLLTSNHRVVSALLPLPGFQRPQDAEGLPSREEDEAEGEFLQIPVPPTIEGASSNKDEVVEATS